MLTIDFFKNDTVGFEQMKCDSVPKVGDIVLVEDARAEDAEGMRYRITNVMMCVNQLGGAKVDYSIEADPVEEYVDIEEHDTRERDPYANI